MLKKSFLLLLGAFLAFNVSFANTSSESNQEQLSGLFGVLDKKIAEKPELLEQYLTTISSLEKHYRDEMLQALEQNHPIESIRENGDMIHEAAKHLYQLQEEKNQKKISYSGQQYNFKSQSFAPRLYMTRGEDAYYAFPQKKAYLQLYGNHTMSGQILNLLSAEYEGKSYLPKYYYEGGYTLQDIGRKKHNEAIRLHTTKADKESYFFFDLPIQEEKIGAVNFKLGDQVLKGKDIFVKPNFSLLHTEKEHSKGFLFCKEVAERKGDSVANKEYPQQECEDAANAKFSPDMHPDILDYAKHLYR